MTVSGQFHLASHLSAYIERAGPPKCIKVGSQFLTRIFKLTVCLDRRVLSMAFTKQGKIMKTINAGFFNHVAAIGLALITVSAGASAATVTFNTNAPGTEYASGGLSLASSGGAAATLTFAPQIDSITGTPSNVNYGIFTLLCNTCTTQANAGGAFFSPFTFNLIITDVTDNATGQFVGTSTGGTVFSDVSPLSITWFPLVLGPGTTNALTGNFGSSTFRIAGPTSIVAPNSGIIPGQTTVEGFVDTADENVPEPATLALLGAGLLFIGVLSKKK